MTFDNLIARNEIHLVGSMYLLSAIAVLTFWIQGNSEDLFKTVAFVSCVIILSRIASLRELKDFNDIFFIIPILETPIFIWAFLGLKKYGKEGKN